MSGTSIIAKFSMPLTERICYCPAHMSSFNSSPAPSWEHIFSFNDRPAPSGEHNLSFNSSTALSGCMIFPVIVAQGEQQHIFFL